MTVQNKLLSSAPWSAPFLQVVDDFQRARPVTDTADVAAVLGRALPTQAWLSWFLQVLKVAGVTLDLNTLQALTAIPQDATEDIRRSAFMAWGEAQTPPVDVAGILRAADLARTEAPPVDEPAILRRADLLQALQSPESQDELKRLVMMSGQSDQRPESPRLIIDLHANRALYAPDGYPVGTLFYETDRTVYYIILELGGVRKWWFFTGQMRNLLANIPTDLGVEDIEFLFYGIDYRHTWRWTSLMWDYAAGDRRSGEFATFGVNPGVGWAACDGSNVTMSHADATTGVFATPDLSGDIFLMGGVYDGTRRAATRAKWEAAAKTETAAHTHSVGPFSTTSDVDLGAGQVVQSGTGVTVAAHTHSHQVPFAADTAVESPAHAHVLADANAQLKKPSEADGGLPLRMSLEWYVRL